jgi:hypothetical protein|tara:strand:- start:327 stop:1448 length:1122 start_codon:yes stop_codon:yes gene_type:complete
MLNIIFLLYICIFQSCAPLNKYAEEFPADDPISLGEQDYIYENEDGVLLELPSSGRSDQIFEKLYNCEDVYIRLRITLHIFYYMSTDEDGNQKFHVYSPVTIDKIIEDIEYAESVYENLNLKFKVTSVSAVINKIDVDNDEAFSFELARRMIYNDYKDNFEFLTDAARHSDSISVFYTLSIGDGISGLSIFPWSSNPYGIQIVRTSARKYVFAHEIGHYFGLYHTFQDPTDHVEDTPYKKLTMDEVGTSEDPNRDNIMSYPALGEQELHLTTEQLARVKAFLTISRESHVILDEDEDSLLIGLLSTDEEREEFLYQCREMLIGKIIVESELNSEPDNTNENQNNINNSSLELDSKSLNLHLNCDEKFRKCCDH